VYGYVNDSGDTITDFNPLPGGDKIDLKYLFNADLNVPSNLVNTTYLRFIQSGANTLCQVDPDSFDPASFVTMATLNNVNASLLSVAAGNVIV
jgi:hypothetical protein